MKNTLHITGVTKWLKLITFICATALLIINNPFGRLAWLIPIVVLLVLIDYYRDYRLVADNKPDWQVWASIVLEMLLIMSIGFIDKNDINLLYFFVCISYTIISRPFLHALPLAVGYILPSLLISAVRNGFENLPDTIVPLLINYCVSTAFVAGMSYLVKIQIREKEKLEHMNAELELAYKKLIDNAAIVQKLSVEQERTRMAREIHDTLAHTLTSLIVQLEACKALSEKIPSEADPARLQAELEKAQQLSRSGFNDVKRTIKALRPLAMENKPFIDSILTIINESMENTNVKIELNNSLASDAKLSSQTEVALFRVIQESITNSIRHGGAGEIRIDIGHDHSMLQCCISDNGAGCAAIRKGYGTTGIRERVESLNGNVQFLSAAGKGFTTRVSIPSEVI